MANIYRYPNTQIEWVDQSQIGNVNTTNIYEVPLFFTAFTSDKGPEEMMVSTRNTFFNRYGNNISFAKHGQPLLQAAYIVNNGGVVLAKRIVAEDAALANKTVVAKVSQKVEKTYTDKVDADGKKLYKDPVTGLETTTQPTIGADPIKITVVNEAGQPLYLDPSTGLQTPVKPSEDAIPLAVTKTDESGNVLYLDPNTGLETTVQPMIPADPIQVESTTVTGVNISYITDSIENMRNVDEVANAIKAKYSKAESETEEGTFLYPLFTITDNGRGKSAKKFRIIPDYINSKYSDEIKYYIWIMEGNDVLEKIDFTLDCAVVSDTEGINKSIQNVIKNYSEQSQAKEYEDKINAFTAKIADLVANVPNASTDYTAEYFLHQDILFGNTKNGDAIPVITVDTDDSKVGTDTVNLSYTYGLTLDNGDNGEFGDAPFSSEDGTPYEKAMTRFFNGDVTDDIYDLDNYPIDLCVDANFPKNTKKAIADLADYREDFVYLRDMGLNVKTVEAIKSISENYSKSRYIANYHLSYDIVDPFSKRQITVTVGYSLTRIMINIFRNGRILPAAGSRNGAVIPEAIKGTVNFIPTVTPKKNNKEKLYDMRVNYASYINNVLTLETIFTSQDVNSQLSYINNVLAIQEVVKAIRKYCPKNRYSFLDQTDLQTYQNDVNTLLNSYMTNFTTLALTYIQDETMVANKIFYAALKVQCRDFIQSEYIKVYVLGNENSSSNTTV